MSLLYGSAPSWGWRRGGGRRGRMSLWTRGGELAVSKSLAHRSGFNCSRASPAVTPRLRVNLCEAAPLLHSPPPLGRTTAPDSPPLVSAREKTCKGTLWRPRLSHWLMARGRGPVLWLWWGNLYSSAGKQWQFILLQCVSRETSARLRLRTLSSLAQS